MSGADGLERLLEQTAPGFLVATSIPWRSSSAWSRFSSSGCRGPLKRYSGDPHPADHRRYHPALERLEREITALLDRVEARRGLGGLATDRPHRPSEEAQEEDRGRALFADTRRGVRTPVPGQTRRCSVLAYLPGPATAPAYRSPHAADDREGGPVVIPAWRCLAPRNFSRRLRDSSSGTWANR